MYMYIHVCICTYIYIERERDIRSMFVIIATGSVTVLGVVASHPGVQGEVEVKFLGQDPLIFLVYIYIYIYTYIEIDRYIDI